MFFLYELVIFGDFNTSRTVLFARLRMFLSIFQYNGDFKVKDKLPVDDVIEILNKRMRYVDQNGRFLREEEKVILKSLLRGVFYSNFFFIKTGEN